MAAQLTPAQRARMNPEQIRLYNQQAGIREPTVTTPFPTPTTVTPQVIPKPTVNPNTGTPLGATPVNGSQPLVNTATTPFETPTPQPPAPAGSASVITGQPPAPQSPPPPGTVATAPSMGGNAPVSQTPFPTQGQPQQVYQPNMGAGDVVTDYMSRLLNGDSAYIQSARRSGLETAANRGLLNSSIAAGNAERSAIDAAQPLVNEIMGLHSQREQNAFQGEQNQLNRDQELTMSQVQDWLNNNQFNREFNGQLALLPITSVTALNNALLQAAIDDPNVFPSDVVNGFSEFFSNNLLSMLASYFPNQYGNATGGGT